MRVALKVAYDGRAFYGHQRQPEARTVEGECLRALRAAHILSDPREAYFRSASRTDRGVSAVGNVIAFDAAMRPDAVLGAFNGKARNVWAWAYAAVPDSFHPRHAEERWYRYFLLDPPPMEPLRASARRFQGEHDFRWFTSDPSSGPFTLREVVVGAEPGAVTIDFRARSFRRTMIRRIVAAMLAHARDEIRLEDIEATLTGVRHDFGVAPAEPLLLMDVRYPFDFIPLLKPKVAEEWAWIRSDLALRSRWVGALHEAVSQSGPNRDAARSETAGTLSGR
jgi:tRNA pseudouridine38-40 synthase